MTKSIYLIITLCLIFFSLNATGDEDARSLQAKRLAHVGAMVSSIGTATIRLGEVLETENAGVINDAITDLQGGVENFTIQLKEVIGEDYYDYADAISREVHLNLAMIQEHVNQENFDKARDEYHKMLDNWEELGDFYLGRMATVLQNREEVQGWIDWFFDWWYEKAEN